MSAPVQLRPYQERVVSEARQAFRTMRTVLLQMPTGAGKTLTAGHILGSAAAKGHQGIFICNRIELVDQTAAAFDKLRINYGLIVPGVRPDPFAPVQIASIQTLQRRILKGTVAVPRLAVWDECRSIAAKGWKSVFDRWDTTKHLGLDATPERLDGTGLGNFFQHMVLGPAYSELVELGNLVPFESYAPTQPDTSAIKKVRGDLDPTQLAELMDKPALVGDIVQHYLRHARTLDGLKLGLTFAVSRRHSEHLAEAYRAAGVPAAHLDGDTDPAVRKKMVEAYRRRELKVLTNVDLFSAGFDVPGVEVISMGRPTKSITMFLQQAGRASRPEDGKTFGVLLDHAGNIREHGLPDEDRVWTLSDRPKKEKKAKDSLSVRVCEACYRAYTPPGRICIYCGHEHEPTARELEEIEGELQRITKENLAAAKAAEKAKKVEEKQLAKASREAARAARAAENEARKAFNAETRRQVSKARTLEQLKAIAAARGYDDNWAEHTFAAKARAHERHAQNRAEAQWDAYRR